MKWLCDTNIISEVFQKKPNQKVVDWLSRQDEIFLSVITVEEIYCGLSHKNATKRIEWFEKFMSLRCLILPVTKEIARHCGGLRGRFLQKVLPGRRLIYLLQPRPLNTIWHWRLGIYAISIIVEFHC